MEAPALTHPKGPRSGFVASGRKVRLGWVAAPVDPSVGVILADGAVDGDARGDHEGVRRAVPGRVEALKGEVLDTVCGFTGYHRD
jgi:hypothetical protein